MVSLTLPTSITGLKFTFTTIFTFELRILGDIRSGGNNITSNTIGSYLLIEMRNVMYMNRGIKYFFVKEGSVV